MKTIRTQLAIICLGICMCLVVSSPVHAKKKDHVSGELLVKFKPDTTRAEIKLINKDNNCKIIKKFKFIDVYHLKIKSGLTVEEVVDAYNDYDSVEFAAPNRILHGDQRTVNNAETWPNDHSFTLGHAKYGKQWPLDNWGQTAGTVDADIDAPQMWRMITDSDVTVAILDSGIDTGHPDLVDNIWTNPDEKVGDDNGDGCPGVCGIDDDNDGKIDEDSQDRVPGDPGYNNDLVNDDDENGYIDDIKGWDFVGNDNNPSDEFGHGTHVAGIVGAVGNNGLGVTGVCWSVPLMIVRVLNDENAGTEAGIVEAIDYAIGKGARIFNMSFSNPGPFPAIALAVGRIEAAGGLIVASAGNNGHDIDAAGNMRFPAGYPNENIITVAASNHTDTLPSFSNWGATSVDLAAPGDCIYSTMPTYNVTLNVRNNPCTGADYVKNYDEMAGTSMAVPHVSGAAALCWAMEPSLTNIELRTVLLDAADSFNAAEKEKKPEFSLGGNGEVVTEGRLRVAQNAEFGDAPDSPYPTNWSPTDQGAIHLDCGLEWLGDDVSVERSADNFDGTDTDGVANIEDNDYFDDGVDFFPPYFCNDAPLVYDRVDVTITVSDPTSGRYGGDFSDGKFLYLNSFFDFNNDGDWDDVFTCETADDAPEHLLIQEVAGPGAASVLNTLPADRLIIDPSLWGGSAERTSRRIELYFYSPPDEDVDENFKIYTRFRLEYDDKAPFPDVPNHKYLGTYSDYSLFGEVEDYIVECELLPGDPDYDEWVDVGKPYCWCFDSQCQGDADGKTEGGGVLGTYHVGIIDIGVLAGAWRVNEPTKGPGITSVNIGGIPGACADFDHIAEGGDILGIWRVGTGDIGILASNWMIKEPTKGPGIAKTCLPGTFISQ